MGHSDIPILRMSDLPITPATKRALQLWRECKKERRGQPTREDEKAIARQLKDEFGAERALRFRVESPALRPYIPTT